MILKLKSPLLLIILSLFFYSCEKEYSLEGSLVGGTAAFTFAGSPGACTTPVITGSYDVGVALGATNIATISVNVTTVGTYAITVGPINGITFAATGSFTNTGTQLVQLTGSGTPLAGGSFDFLLGSGGCTFSVVVTDNSGIPAVYTYNGAPGSCVSPVIAGVYTAGTALSAANTATITVNVTTRGSWSISTPEVNGITFSGSGTFSGTGDQPMVLTATGTPASEGIAIITPSNNGCSFNITVLPASTTTDYLTCTIGGVAKTFNTDLTGDKLTADTLEINGNEASLTNAGVFGFRLTKSPEITIGSYNRYVPATNASIFCLAGYGDGTTGTQYFTSPLPTAVEFTIVVSSYTPNRITGTFSGTLYGNPLLGSEPIVISNGQFSVPY